MVCESGLKLMHWEQLFFGLDLKLHSAFLYGSNSPADGCLKWRWAQCFWSFLVGSALKSQVFQTCPPVLGELNNLLPITPLSVWDFWWKREQQCQLLLLEWHFYVYWHFLRFISVPEPSQTTPPPLAFLAADSSPWFTLWSHISRQCCALALWDSHALSPC